MTCPRPGWRAQCELAAFGYSRDGKRGRMQVGYGLLTDPDGRPVGIDLFKGNIADAKAFTTAISKVRRDFGLKELVFAGDRGMITKTQIADLRELDGAGWVTVLKAPDIAALAADGGPLQLSLFDEHNLAEITHPITPASGWCAAATRPWLSGRSSGNTRSASISPGNH
jgi:hypothetical protein